jgi:hypothetical protein
MLLGSAHDDAEDGDGATLDGQAPDLALHRAEIDQATGMLTVQLDVPVAEAFARLRAYAYAQDRRLADVAATSSPGGCGWAATRVRTAARDRPGGLRHTSPGRAAASLPTTGER